MADLPLKEEHFAVFLFLYESDGFEARGSETFLLYPLSVSSPALTFTSWKHTRGWLQNS